MFSNFIDHPILLCSVAFWD